MMCIRHCRRNKKSCNPFRYMHIHHDLGIMSLVSFVSFCRWILQCMDALVCFSQILFICLFACFTCFNHCRWTLWNPHDDVSLYRHGWTPWLFDSCPRSTNITLFCYNKPCFMLLMVRARHQSGRLKHCICSLGAFIISTGTRCCQNLSKMIEVLPRKVTYPLSKTICSF